MSKQTKSNYPTLELQDAYEAGRKVGITEGTYHCLNHISSTLSKEAIRIGEKLNVKKDIENKG